MATTKIDWAERVWNPIVGCDVVSAGCTNCYAMAMAARLARMNPDLAQYRGLTRKVNGNSVWTGRIGIAPDSKLFEPLRRRKPTVYFVNSMGDIFHKAVPFDAIDRVFAVMALSPQHFFVVLTKRPARMREYSLRHDGNSRHPAMTYAALVAATGGWNTPSLDLRSWPLPNVVLGISVEEQMTANQRVPILLDTPAATRIVSYEPALGQVDFLRGADWARMAPRGSLYDKYNPLSGRWEYDRDETGSSTQTGRGPRIDGIIMGGESGPNARDWDGFDEAARATRDQCREAGVAFYMKQMPRLRPIPHDLMVRELPWRISA